ncbi:TetR/AcrR family transcriptional regulator [Leifsonia kafniensis]|uniref:TetR/AcrR family transcriptional regulator n=1 Tax=Leifsonia kafniensis TaxID=475957 RepID=A0ABP7K085_9MICO
MEMSGKTSQRADAAKNRERLVASARRVFAKQGPDAPLEDVARAAGVSRTTLYRHFRTREELAATVLEENVVSIEKRAAELSGQWRAIETLFDFVLDQQRDDGGLIQLFTRSDLAPLESLSRRTTAAFEPLLEAGLRDGTVQPDIEIRDIMIAFPMAEAAITDSARIGDRGDDRARAMFRRALWQEKWK